MKRVKLVSVAASLAMFCTAPSTCVAASLPRLAIFFQADSSMSTLLATGLKARFTEQLVQSHKFVIVERVNLKRVLQEQGLSNSAYADPDTAAQLGKILGATEVLTVKVASEADDSSGAFVDNHDIHDTATFQLLEVDTARVLSTGVAEGDGSQHAAHSGTFDKLKITRDAMESCADDLANKVLNPQ